MENPFGGFTDSLAHNSFCNRALEINISEAGQHFVEFQKGFKQFGPNTGYDTHKTELNGETVNICALHYKEAIGQIRFLLMYDATPSQYENVELVKHRVERLNQARLLKLSSDV